MKFEKYGFVADSSLGVSKEYQETYGVKVAKLSLFSDGKEIPYDTSNEDLIKLINEGHRVTTAQPSQGEYLDCYEELIKQGKEKILVFTVSRFLSGSFESANKAIFLLDEKDQEKVYVYDTLSVSQGSAYPLYKSVEILKKDDSITFDELVSKLDVLRQDSYLLFAVDNLDTIYKNGRLGKIKYIIGSLLRIRPILTYHLGELSIVSRQMTVKGIYNYMCQRIKKELDKENKKVTVYVSYVENKTNYDNLLNHLNKEFEGKVNIVPFGYISQIISVHIGPGGLGMLIAVEDK